MLPLLVAASSEAGHVLTRKEARELKAAEEADRWERARESQELLSDFSKAMPEEESSDSR